MIIYVVLIVLIALVFDFTNGFNDAANSVATIVATRVLSPRKAVVWAAFFNFVAAFGFETHVARTIGTGLVDPRVIDPHLVLASLLAAIIWTVICTEKGLPISVSHALIGGLAGAGVVKAGLGVLVPEGLIKVAAFIVLSPLLGLVLGYFFMLMVFWIFRNFPPRKVDSLFRIGQLLSSATFSLGHGMNDAQKTMGIIVLALYTAHYQNDFHVPVWVIFACYTAIALGTLSGGWRVVNTLGMRVTKLRPVGGFCAELAAAVSIIGNSIAGIPVSTTHTITGAVVGVGSTQRLTAVRWGVSLRIIWAWVLTIPGSALVAALAFLALEFAKKVLLH